LEIIRLANIGYNQNYQFLSQKWKLNPTSNNLVCHYKRAGDSCQFWKVACDRHFLKQLGMPIMARTNLAQVL